MRIALCIQYTTQRPSARGIPGRRTQMRGWRESRSSSSAIPGLLGILGGKSVTWDCPTLRREATYCLQSWFRLFHNLRFFFDFAKIIKESLGFIPTLGPQRPFPYMKNHTENSDSIRII
jgi:hypothetical protein